MDLNLIRYRGDLEDTKALYDVYQVKQIIDSHENILKEHNSFREQLLANSVRLTPIISPRIFSIIEEVKEKFQLQQQIEFFSLNDLNYNALAFKLDTKISIVFTSALLENFNDDEILFVLGHEIGHILFDHNRLLLLYNPSQKDSTFLPILAEKKFLGWQKKAEISCDRVGLIACGNYETAVQALLKISYGLTEKNLNFNLPELMKQLEDLKESNYSGELSTASHPILPVRIKAIELFYQSELYHPSNQLKHAELTEHVDQLIHLTSLYPRKKTAEMTMKFVAAGGINLIAVERDIQLEEIKSLIKILANVFTDDPEKEILYDKTAVEKQIEKSSEFLRNKASENERYYALHFLTLVALADGQFTKREKDILLHLAGMIGFTADDAMGVIWQTLQQNGIHIDVKLNEIAENIKQNYTQLTSQKILTQASKTKKNDNI
ncbi:MAG: M48 family metalloprotease [Candidatus Cloacimonetes bacterium]|nr:M48 family metalloprotease [Candidatus Cloacimonadota bacterium]